MQTWLAEVTSYAKKADGRARLVARMRRDFIYTDRASLGIMKW
jgi:hypothetical protein